MHGKHRELNITFEQAISEMPCYCFQHLLLDMFCSKKGEGKIIVELLAKQWGNTLSEIPEYKHI